MQLVSVNVGLPRTISWKGRTVQTGIFKTPVNSRIQVRTLNLEGDGQADLSVHGGPDKAIYAYPFEHYDFWRGEFPDMELPWGTFGENLTTTGLSEEALNIGDTLRIGSAVAMITQPRLPCYKLAAKFGREEMITRFLSSGRSGFYLKVMQEGAVSAGDSIELLERDSHAVTVAELTKVYRDGTAEVSLLQRAVQVTALPESWRERFQHQIDHLQR
jgi:MOSC domain-containing protein YiiM